MTCHKISDLTPKGISTTSKLLISQCRSNRQEIKPLFLNSKKLPVDLQVVMQSMRMAVPGLGEEVTWASKMYYCFYLEICRKRASVDQGND
jgi:hypothetical protein